MMVDAPMLGRLRWLAIFLACTSTGLPASPQIRSKVIGDIRWTPQSVNFRLEVIQPAGVAIVYDDNVGSRQRLLTADGRITELRCPVMNNALFDKYVWNPNAGAAYGLGSKVVLLSVPKRNCVVLAGQPRFLRDIDYVARWGAIVAAGADGLYVVGADRLVPLPFSGPHLNDVVRVKDMSRFRALFLETIDKRLFLRTDDGVLHSLGSFAGRWESSQEVVELRNSPAIQISGSQSIAHVDMARDGDGIWRPSRLTWYQLGGISPGLNQYVPQLDAMVVRPFFWMSAFDWWFDRSGLYKVTNSGLMPIGSWSQHVAGYSALTNLPAAGISLYEPARVGNSSRAIYRLTADGRLVQDRRLASLGRYFNVHEIKGTGQLIAVTNTGSWRWDGKGAPVRLTDLGWVGGQPMPLTGEVFLPSSGHNLLIDRSGRVLQLPTYAGGGSVFQVDRDRWFEFGKSIVEVRLRR
jgi:hypothetical protein